MVWRNCLFSFIQCTLNCKECDVEKKLIKVRKQVNNLYFKQGWSKNRIVRQLGVSKHFVIKWTKDSSQDVTIDHRGWPLGKRRKCRAETEERIYRIYNYLKEEASEFFYGATAISRELNP